MCGIFGVIGKGVTSEAIIDFESLANHLERRGHDAFGFTGYSQHNSTIEFGKIARTYSKAKSTSEYLEFKKNILKVNEWDSFIFGHTRLATHGGVEDSLSNHPVLLNNWIAVHNGIIVNEDNLKKNFFKEYNNHQFQLDTYAALAFLDSAETGKEMISLTELFLEFSSLIQGANNFAFHSSSLNHSILFSTNGSLYLKNKNEYWLFSSEKSAFIDDRGVSQIKYPLAFIYNHETGNGQIVDLEIANPVNVLKVSYPHKYKEITEKTNTRFIPQTDLTKLKNILNNNFEETLLKISKLKRCTKCLLPESFPGIAFDENDVCNICLNYQKSLPENNFDGLKNEIIKRGDNKVLVSLSGGRDSCFTLHKIVKEMGLEAVAFTYDWGMVTDLARRNQSRFCGKLGVEHIIVSADIQKKRTNIRKNVSAWLKNPSLGTIPLFMAGDKHYFYYAEKIKKENSLKFNIMGENQLEKTGFKSKFAGVDQTGSKSSMAYNLSAYNKIKILLYYGSEFLKNPEYLNSSMLDTFTGYLSYYVLPRSYLNLFDYIPWRESEVEGVLKEYDWEYSSDCKTSWRIGDGTAPFYNVIYHSAAGFTENDTLRANQIREGHLEINDARKLIERDNFPRSESFSWYCEALKLDSLEVAKQILKVPKYYPDK